MKINEIMHEGLELVSPDATLDQAAELMRDDDIGALPVGEGNRLTGMVTDRDIVIRAVADGRDPAQTTVRTVMTPDVLFVYDHQDIEEAARIMAARQVRRLPVLDRSQRPIGMVSLADVSRHAGDAQLAGQTLKHVSHPTPESRG
jgi:CBS domain-containing protein